MTCPGSSNLVFVSSPPPVAVTINTTEIAIDGDTAHFVPSEVLTMETGGDGSRYADLEYTPVAGSLGVLMNGVELVQGVDYTISAQRITFLMAIPAGAEEAFVARYLYVEE